MTRDNDVCWDCGIEPPIFRDPEGLCIECRRALNRSNHVLDKEYNGF